MSHQTRLLLASFFYVLATMAHALEPADSLGSWSAFGKLDLDKLAAGKVVTQCNTSMKFPRGLCAQAAYVVAAPVEITGRVLLDSDPTKHAELDVYQHHRFRDANDAAFEKLTLDPQIKAVRNLLAAMPKREDLQLTANEVALLPKSAAREDAELFWKEVLRERWVSVAARGDLGGADQYDTRAEIKSLLAEESGIAQHFDALLAPVAKPAAPLVPASYFWEVSNVNGLAACTLGAAYTREADGRRQVLEMNYYVSSGYLTSVTLYELLPFMHAGKPCTLVWQGSLVSAPGLAGAFGVKRKIASVLTLADLERSIRLFQQDAARASAARSRE